MRPPLLTLIGAGRLGWTLGRLWAENGTFAIGDVVTRSHATAEAATAFIGQGHPRARDEALEPADAVLIAVPDDRLAVAAAALADSTALRQGTVVFHCSGALDAELLAPLRAAGATVASAHPMHSFADPAGSLTGFRGTWCALEGDCEAVDRLEPAFAAIGGRPLRISSEAKLLYHAGGVFAANYVTALLDVATRLVTAAGVPRHDALELLAPLVRGSIESVLTIGPRDALTGPVARGDSALVARQAEAVANHDPGLGALYRELGRTTLELARASGHLDERQLALLAEALTDPD